MYEIPPGAERLPVPLRVGDEEWLIVLEGRPTIRDARRRATARARRHRVLPEGPEGAHAVPNHGEETVRVLMLSTWRTPAIAVYPDRDKVGVWGGHGVEEGFFRRDDEGRLLRPRGLIGPARDGFSAARSPSSAAS